MIWSLFALFSDIDSLMTIFAVPLLLIGSLENDPFLVSLKTTTFFYLCFSVDLLLVLKLPTPFLNTLSYIFDNIVVKQYHIITM
jgi:hypothetical protein